MKKRWYPHGKHWVLVYTWGSGQAAGIYSSRKLALEDAARIIAWIVDETWDEDSRETADVKRLVAAGDPEALLAYWEELATEDYFSIQEVSVDKPIDVEKWFEGESQG